MSIAAMYPGTFDPVTRGHEDLVRRVVDFSSGLIYALDGTMSKVGEGLVLVLPPNMTLDDTEKRRLASLGAYEERI